MGALLKPVTWLHGEVEARAVAKEFLICHEDRGGTRLTAPLVNKLVLFAHGLMLARYDQPMVREPFELWVYGPVSRSLHHDLWMFGVDGMRSESGFIPIWPRVDNDRMVSVIHEVYEGCHIKPGHEGEALMTIKRFCKDAPWGSYRVNGMLMVTNSSIRSVVKGLLKIGF